MTVQAELIAARECVGATSPIGRRLSTLGEQIKNGVSVGATLAEIEQLKRDGGAYVHSHHMALAVILRDGNRTIFGAFNV